MNANERRNLALWLVHLCTILGILFPDNLSCGLKLARPPWLRRMERSSSDRSSHSNFGFWPESDQKP